MSRQQENRQTSLPIAGPGEPKRPRRINAVVSIPVTEGVKPMTYRPDSDLHTKLLLHSMAHGTSMQKIIDEALRNYLTAKGG
jgi:hypothetical protein